MFKHNPNYYIGDLPESAVADAINHARAEWPNESCGAIVGGQYVPYVNTHDNPLEGFLIEDADYFLKYAEGAIQCLVHSHDNYNMASVVDQQQQREMMVPWLIINMHQKSVKDCILFGGDTAAPVLGRPFFYGVFDCITCTSDYMLEKFGVKIPFPVHEWEFWVNAEPVFEKAIEENTKPLKLKEITTGERRTGDLIFYNMYGTRYINHVGVVYSDHGEVLHHFVDTKSDTYPVYVGNKYRVKVLRLGVI